MQAGSQTVLGGRREVADDHERRRTRLPEEDRAMSRQRIMQDDSHRATGDDARRWLLAGAPIKERRLDLAGVSTAVLEAGDGPPVVLLHEPGRLGGDVAAGGPGWPTATTWSHPTCRAWAHRRCRTAAGRGAGAAVARCADRAHLPGAAGAGGRLYGRLDRRPLRDHPPDRLSRLVLVDSGSLARFRPAPRSCAGHDPASSPDQTGAPATASSGRCWWIRRASGEGWASAGRLSRRTTSTLPARRACGPANRLLRGSERGRSARAAQHRRPHRP